MTVTARHRVPRIAVASLALFVALISGCRRADAPADSSRGSAPGEPPRPVASGSYSVVTLDSVGSVTGSVRIFGAVPADSVVHPTSDVGTCGSELTDVSVDSDGSALGGVVVWLEGVHAGKPLPLVKRFDVVNEGCLIAPRVQTAIVGGTLDVRSRDPITHRTRITRTGVAEPVALVTETESGQVVPLDHALDAPGMLQLRCDLHPWTRAWIAVFDHPYFATTGRDGTFALDSVPPGRYTLNVWHERFGTLRREVVVHGGEAAAAAIELSAPAPPAR